MDTVLRISRQLRTVFRPCISILIILVLVKALLILEDVQVSIHEIQKSIKDWSAVSVVQQKEWSAFLSTNQKNITDTVANLRKTTEETNLLVRQIRLSSLKQLDQVILHLDRQTLVNVDQLLKDSSALVIASQDGIRVITQDSDACLKELIALVRSPEIHQTLVEILQIAQKAELSSSALADMTQMIRDSLPALLEELKAITGNGNSISESAAKLSAYVTELVTKKPSWKERVFRAILFALTYGVPIYLQGRR